MAKLRVKDVAYRHTQALDLTRIAQSKEWDKLANICVLKARAALDMPGPFSGSHSDHVSDVFMSMQVTQGTIRRVLEAGFHDPTSVDALALARLQLEGVYAMCLFTENPTWIDVYVQDYWRKRYVIHLLSREELKDLAAPDAHQEPAAALEGLRQVFRITREQQLTVDHEELGTPLPDGVTPQPLPRFPTPRGVIHRLPLGDKRRLLERLYPEYEHLCSFAHGLPFANLYKHMFNDRSPHRDIQTDGERQKRFEQEVQGLCYVISNVSIAQATTELLPHYPDDVDLRVAAMTLWAELSDSHLLARALWHIRTQSVLGVLG